ncbi:MAG: hypothetical protein ACK5GZ_13430 [Cyanobium sp.]
MAVGVAVGAAVGAAVDGELDGDEGAGVAGVDRAAFGSAGMEKVAMERAAQPS